MLNPCSPPGRQHPTIRSSTAAGSSCGTLASAAVTIWASRSSGLIELSDPLNARPMGERAVATITASGMTVPSLEKLRVNATVTAIIAPQRIASRRGGIRLLDRRDGQHAPASAQDSDEGRGWHEQRARQDRVPEPRWLGQR